MPGAHAMDNDAVRLRAELGRISLEINQQITAVNLAQLELRAAAEDLLAIKTTNDKVNSAAGILMNRVVEDLKRTVAQMVSIRATVEDYQKEI